jgi:hypothetical protein
VTVCTRGDLREMRDRQNMMIDRPTRPQQRTDLTGQRLPTDSASTPSSNTSGRHMLQASASHRAEREHHAREFAR